MKLGKVPLLLLEVAVATLALAGAVLANENRTPFTGTSTMLYEGWPDKFWVPGPHVAYWRGMTFVLALETTDGRVTGIVCADHNGNYQVSDDPASWYVEGQMWGKAHIFPPGAFDFVWPYDCEQPGYIWEGSFVGDRAEDGSETSRYNYKGRGPYEKLQLRYDVYQGSADPSATVTGELLDPGN